MITFTKIDPMTPDKNNTENCIVLTVKKAWSSPAFEIMPKGKIKSGSTHKPTPETNTPAGFSYIS